MRSTFGGLAATFRGLWCDFLLHMDALQPSGAALIRSAGRIADAAGAGIPLGLLDTQLSHKIDVIHAVVTLHHRH